MSTKQQNLKRIESAIAYAFQEDGEAATIERLASLLAEYGATPSDVARKLTPPTFKQQAE